MSNETDDVMGTRKAAAALGVSVRTVQLWVENGTLKAWKTPGKHRRILRSSVDALLSERAADAADVPGTDNDVLIVEDEITMQTYYEALFELLRPDIPIRFADNGFTGLVEFGRKAPQLMLLDLDMPGMDGLEMIRALGGTAQDDVAIVVVTSLSHEQIEARGGLDDSIPVLAKPLSADALQELLDSRFPTPKRSSAGSNK